MFNIAVMTDSNSGITQSMAKELGVYVLPMPFYINENLYKEGLNLTQEQFYEFLLQDAEISTSQPNPMEVTQMWDEILKTHDQIIYIPMSSGLSASCDTARALAQDYEGKVYVVDNKRIAPSMYQAVLDAQTLISQGKTAEEVQKVLEDTALDASIYITLDTLKYLKKGGRITPAAAALGTVLNLKPVLQIQGDKLDSFAKARGKVKAKKIMLEAIHSDLEKRFKEYWDKGEMRITAAYAGNPEEAQHWKEEVMAEFGQEDIYCAPLPLSISCHIGHGALAVTCIRILK